MADRTRPNGGTVAFKPWEHNVSLIEFGVTQVTATAMVEVARENAKAEKYRSVVPARHKTWRSFGKLVPFLLVLTIFAGPAITSIESGDYKAGGFFVAIILGALAIPGGERAVAALAKRIWPSPRA